MKNIHILPTDKPSRLQLNKHNKIFLSEELKLYSDCINQNIYITNDEEIKEGDWYLNNGHLLKCTELKIRSSCKKIILTTDQDLIKDGVQKIDDEFLEWFVKNQNCEFVKVEVDLSKHNGKFQTKYGYKIIIPKEELGEIPKGTINMVIGKPKQELPGVGEQTFKIILEENWLKKKETLEEVNPFELPKSLPDDVFYESLEPKQETLEEFIKEVLNEEFFTNISEYRKAERLMELGAKWQQKKTYSEEDMKLAFEAGHKKGFSGYPNTENWKEFPFEEWFEQFKKK